MENTDMEYICRQEKEPLILEPEDYPGDEWSTILKVFGMEEAERIVISDYKFEAYGRTRKCYFDGTYTIFCFEVYGSEPLCLHVGADTEDIVTIKDLDKLNGCFEGDYFCEDKLSYNLFVDFLKSITLKPNSAILPMYHDIRYTKDHFHVNMKIL